MELSSKKCAENFDNRAQGYSDKVRHVKLKHLKVYGYIQCDTSGYDEYTMIELVDEFCSEVPSFFVSYDHLELLFRERYRECGEMMNWLRRNFLAPPVAPLQAKLAAIIQNYFCNLPWLNV